MVQKHTNQPSIIFTIACVYYLADQLLPVMQYLSSVYIMISMVVVILVTIFISKSRIRVLTFIMPFMLILIMQLLFGLQKADTLKSIILSFYTVVLFILPAIISFYLILNNYSKTIKLMLIISIIFLVITSISSVYGLIDNPLASKEMATGMQGDPNLMIYYGKNIAGFGITYMIPVILPLLFALYNKNKINFLLLTIISIPLIYFVIATQYANALLALILSLPAIFLAKKYSLKKFIFLGLTAVVFFFIFKPAIGNFFYYIASNSRSMDITVRFNALGDKMMGIETTKDVYVYRQEAYNRSVGTFLASPVFGGFFTNRGKEGGHSVILDIIASFGSIGIIALFLTYRQIYRYFYKQYRSNSCYGYMLWGLLISIFLSFLNTSFNNFAISMFIPLVAYSLQNTNTTGRLKPQAIIPKNVKHPD